MPYRSLSGDWHADDCPYRRESWAYVEVPPADLPDDRQECICWE